MQPNPQTAREGLQQVMVEALTEVANQLAEHHAKPRTMFHADLNAAAINTIMAAIDAYVSDEVRRARINTAEILKTKSGWYSQLGHDGLEDTLVPVSEIDKYIAHLTRSPDQTEGGGELK